MVKGGFKQWIKKYGAYCVAGVLIVAIAVTIIVSGGDIKAVNTNISNANNPVVSVDAKPEKVLTFALPMVDAQILKDFSQTELYYNSTLERWEYHDGMDLTSSDLSVYAIADGKVSNIYDNFADGKVIEITHDNGLKSVYSSLSSEVLVAVGDEVDKSEKIGTAGDTANNEAGEGLHLHLQMLDKDNNKINPNNYLDFELK